ncbi:MAG: SDR family NAD(P)-dependent oxidoreductase [Burkholderiales bacterium]
MSLDHFKLTGKVAIITGAGGGIGRAIALEFAGAGASVACLDMMRENVEETARLAAKTGQKSLAIVCDVTSADESKAAVERAVQELGPIRVLVNGAAARDPNHTVESCPLEIWNQVFAVNVGSAFLMSKWVIPGMAKAGGGSIIHIASQLGSTATYERAAYCSTKGALISLARAMAIDHAKQNIRVNTLSPGATETDRMPLRFGTMEEARKISGPRHVLGRLGLPEEIARGALYLASDASSFMTGADLLVDGGYNAW